MTAVILCGGFGTRLRGVLHDRPKCLAPVRGRTYLDILTGYLHMQGVGRFIFATGHRGEQVEAWLSSAARQWEWTTSREESPLGTGGALRLAAEKANDANFLAFNADTFLECDCNALWAQHLQSGAAITLVAVKVADTTAFGRIEMANGYLNKFREKGIKGPGLISGGAYALQRDAVLGLPAGAFSFETDVLMPMTLKTSVYLTCGAFLDIGTPEGLKGADATASLFTT
jgi:D-glycero-alpha-D-manno-heptose 1-phosphate guanylyltransferase